MCDMVFEEIRYESCLRKRKEIRISSGMIRHIEVNDLPTRMVQYDEAVQHRETNGWHCEEVDRNPFQLVVLEEGAPFL